MFCKTKEELEKAKAQFVHWEYMETNGGYEIWESDHSWDGCYSSGTMSYAMEPVDYDAINARYEAFKRKSDFYKRHDFSFATPLTEIAQAALEEGIMDIYYNTCYLISLIKGEAELC